MAATARMIWLIYICFANDTQLYLSFNPNGPTDQAMALEAIERCISDLRKWMYRDKLKINDDKTEFLVIGSRQQLLKIHHCSVPASYPDVSLDVRAKEGGKETMGETSGRSCFQDGGKSDGGPIYNF